jgi:hypothetical protein
MLKISEFKIFTVELKIKIKLIIRHWGAKPEKVLQ